MNMIMTEVTKYGTISLKNFFEMNFMYDVFFIVAIHRKPLTNIKSGMWKV